jgi:hypothetical protein
MSSSARKHSYPIRSVHQHQGTELCAWNLPRPIAEAIRSEAARLGTREGALVATVFRGYFCARTLGSNLDL